MDGATANRKGRFLDRFGKSRVRMTGARDIFSRTTKFHHRNSLGNQVTRCRSNDMNTQHFVRFGVGQYLHKAFAISIGAGP